MTRDEFLDGINSWYELREFCSDFGCDVCECIYSQNEMDEYIDSNLLDMARNAAGWEDLLSDLQDYPTGYDYYIRDDDGILLERTKVISLTTRMRHWNGLTMKESLMMTKRMKMMGTMKSVTI